MEGSMTSQEKTRQDQDQDKGTTNGRHDKTRHER